MKVCEVCGKEIDILYPDLWRFKRGDPVHPKWFCSWKHLREYDKRKEQKKMERYKKDGTPAKRPGPKPKTAARPDVPAPIAGGDWEKIPRPAAELKLDGAVRIETPEAKNVQVVEVPEKMRPVPPPIEYKVTAISTDIGEFQFIKRADYIDWTTPTGETVSMSLAEWKELMRIWPFVLKVLGVEL